MTGIGEAVGGALSIRVDGAERSLSRLTLLDWAELQQALAAKHRAWRDQWIALLIKHGLEVTQLPALIRDMEKQPTTGEIWQWLYSPEGTIAVLTISARRSGWTFDPSLFDESPVELTHLATELAGIKSRVDRNGSGGADDIAPLPPTGTISTGESNAPTSGDSTTPTPPG